MPCTVLIVDDEYIVITVLTKAFTDEGFIVRSAQNGAVALQEQAHDRADIILTDVTMPVLDGLALITMLRKRGDPTPVVLMSARADDVMSPLGVPLLHKPFDLNQLLAVVDATLGSVDERRVW